MRGIDRHATAPRVAVAALVVVAVAVSTLWLGSRATGSRDTRPTQSSTQSGVAMATSSPSPSAPPSGTSSPAPSPTPTPDPREAASIDSAGPIRSEYTTTGTWAVRNSTLFMTVDGGATWRQSKLPGVPNELYGYAIAATDADHVWVLRASPESTADSAAFVLYRTSDGGTTWQAAPVPGDPSLGMWLLFWNDTDGTLTTAKTPSEYRGYRTTDGGASWHEAGICQPNAVVTMSDKTTWWSSSAGMARMGGPEALLQMTGTCGRSWTNVRVAGLPNMSGVSLGIPAPPTFFNATTGYLAVNRSNDDGSKSWAQGYRTLDAGRTWAPVGSPTPHWLNWLSFADATHWVGESVDPQLRTVITDDAGKTWREVPRPDDASWFGSSAFGAWFVDARHGFSPAYFPDQPIALAGARHARSAPDLAATVYQTLLVTSDGGVTWVPAHFPS